MGILSQWPFTEEERQEIAHFLNNQNDETKSLWKELVRSIPTKDLWWIINDIKNKWLSNYIEIAQKHNVAPKSHEGKQIKKLTKIILAAFRKEETIETTKNNIEDTLNKKRTKREQEQIISAKKIKKYLETNNKQIFGIFRSYYLISKKETDNFYDTTEFATKKICEIYHRECTEEILELFRDRSRWNKYLEDTDQEIQEDI